MVVLGYAASHGPRRGLASLIGVAAGDVAAIAACSVGFGALLATSATAFTVLKWVGAAYLVYLGIQMWRAPAPAVDAVAEARGASARSAIGNAFTVTALNPKGAIFFGAFLPQFISPGAPAIPQLLLLGGTFIALATLILGTYAVLIGGARRFLRSPVAMRRMQRTGGTLLIGAGVLTAALRRSA
jgi:threonine/homoserine/homoserine lactone efflux protein